MKHDYHARKARRIAAAEAKAAKNAKAAGTFGQKAFEVISHIPPGQPILVGHHSEKRHRRDLERHDTNMRKSIDAEKKAEYYSQKAASIEANDAISSDDPEAVEKLAQKIKKLENLQTFMKITNRLIRKKDRTAFLQLPGATVEGWEKLIQPDKFGGPGFARFELTNNAQNINRLKKRLNALKAVAAIPYSEEVIAGVRLIKNPDAGRVQLKFPSKPEEAIRKRLRGFGFVHCRSEDAWQRRLNNGGIYAARSFLSSLQPPASASTAAENTAC